MSLFLNSILSGTSLIKGTVFKVRGEVTLCPPGEPAPRSLP